MKKSTNLFLSFLVFFNIGILGDDEKQIQSALMSEYQSLLKRDAYNQKRVDEIEDIAIKNPYYDLRQWIAMSYVTSSEVRKVNKENLTKAFNILHKSINENFFRSIPLATYATSTPDLRIERLQLIKTVKKKVSLNLLNDIALADLYIADNNYELALDILEPLKVKMLGLVLNAQTLEVLQVLKGTSTPFLQKGDKLVSINRELISFNELQKVLLRYEEGTKQKLTFIRDNKSFSEDFVVPKKSFSLQKSAYLLAIQSLTNKKDFVESNALDYLDDELLKLSPSYKVFERLVKASLCQFYSTDEKNFNHINAIKFCKDIVDEDIASINANKTDLATYEFYTRINSNIQFAIYKTSLNHLIYQALNLYYGIDVDRNKKESIKLLSDYFPYYTDTTNSNYLWASKVFTEEYISGNILERNPQKAFDYSKKFFGKDDRVTKLITGLVLDGEVDVNESFLKKMTNDKTVKNFLIEKDLYDYVIYKSFFDIKPFDKGDIDTCELAKNNKLIDKNEFTQIVYSTCVIDGDIDTPKHDIAKFINKLSADGISSGTYLIHKYNLNSASYSSDYKKQLGILKLAKNQSKNNKKQKPKQSWLTEAPFLYYAFEGMIDEDIRIVTKQIEEEEQYKLALLKAEKEREKQKIREERAIARREAARKTGNFIGDFLEFTFKAALVVGAAAVVGDALEDASPEDIQALSDSLMGSYDYYTYDWDGFYDEYGNWTYRCRTIENGRFAEDYNCIGEIKDDDRWPTY